MISIEISEDARTAYADWKLGIMEIDGLLPRSGGRELYAEVGRIEEALTLASFAGMVEPCRKPEDIWAHDN